MDHRDKNCGRMEEIYDQLHSAYCQFKNSSTHAERFSYPGDKERVQRLQIPEDLETGFYLFNGGDFTFILKINDMIHNLIMCFLLCFRRKQQPTSYNMAPSIVRFRRSQS
jgi:hypothetical protein